MRRSEKSYWVACSLSDSEHNGPRCQNGFGHIWSCHGVVKFAEPFRTCLLIIQACLAGVNMPINSSFNKIPAHLNWSNPSREISQCLGCLSDHNFMIWFSGGCHAIHTCTSFYRRETLLLQDMDWSVIIYRSIMVHGLGYVTEVPYPLHTASINPRPPFISTPVIYTSCKKRQKKKEKKAQAQKHKETVLQDPL